MYLQKIKLFILLVVISFGAQLFAHPEHDKVSGYKATQIAAVVAKKITFKDLGYKAGKIDISWRDVDKSAYKLEDIQPDFYIVRAYNETVKETLEFKIATDGIVKHVIKQ